MNVILSVKMCYLLKNNYRKCILILLLEYECHFISQNVLFIKNKKNYRKCILILLLEYECHFISQNVLFIKNEITTVNAF